jgi:hypothetical protein
MPSRAPEEKWPSRLVYPRRDIAKGDLGEFNLAMHRRKQWDLMRYPRPVSLMEGIMYDIDFLNKTSSRRNSKGHDRIV